MIATRPGDPSSATRLLGVIGVLGGLALLAAFVVEIPPAWNTVRLFLFVSGAIAVAAAAYGSHAAASRGLALAGTVPLVLANGALIAWILLAVGRDRPFAGDFGLVGFWAGLGLWLATPGSGSSHCGSRSCGGGPRSPSSPARCWRSWAWTASG